VIPAYIAGIDLGSTMTKVVIMDGHQKIQVSVVEHTGAEHRRLSSRVMAGALAKIGIAFEEISYIVATGYGRNTVPFADRQITELTCHARGVSHFFPGVRLAIDIGGQDSKGLKIKDGKLLDFVMSDKCAAGTGRFLELIAESLGVRLEDMGEIAAKSANRVSISSTCTVFARREVMSRISEGAPVEDIVAGIHDSIARRVARMVERLKVEPDVLFTGGVALNTGIVRALEENLGCRVLVPEEPLLSGAIGAALLAREIVQKASARGEPLKRNERRLEGTTYSGS
jgi:predicted CoA-substrate-specific enzyme activase